MLVLSTSTSQQSRRDGWWPPARHCSYSETWSISPITDWREQWPTSWAWSRSGFGHGAGAGDYQRMRGLWLETVGDRIEEIRAAIGEAIEVQYARVSEALEGGHGYVIHGNVDRPGPLRRPFLPATSTHGQARELEGLRFGFVGGGGGHAPAGRR